MLYVWKPDAEYVLASDRSQNTRMVFNYNQFPGQPIGVQEALLTGPAPARHPAAAKQRDQLPDQLQHGRHASLPRQRGWF
ncbi:hypothetical protein LP420_35025 [Massilia sp. B-10]|nr:hypothetical protein LP420_35025 [Massilia sp. B-10]